MLKTRLAGAILLCVLLALPQALWAHFGAVLPQNSMLDSSNRQTEVKLAFLHPFAQQGMDLEKPDKVNVTHMGKSQSRSLLAELSPVQMLNSQAWQLDFQPDRPGVYCLSMDPQPYWEEAEGIFIKHITKTYIAAFGQEAGWSQPLGLETEIVPLTRPFGLYAGNVFQGRVLLDGEPVPGAEVEVEYYNQNQKAQAANEYMHTQVLLADENGVFTYAAPAAGWWGFSALNEADYTLQHQGQDQEVELGAVLWVQFLPWQ